MQTETAHQLGGQYSKISWEGQMLWKLPSLLHVLVYAYCIICNKWQNISRKKTEMLVVGDCLNRHLLKNSV